jgi:uncharacterized metal-binding protein
MSAELNPECARCKTHVCRGQNFLAGPESCPTKTRSDVVDEVRQRYAGPELAEFARVASVVEGEAYTRVPWSDAPSPLTTRLEEIISLATRMGYKKLGVAFCVGLENEANTLISILENCGFTVISVCCKVGGIAKEAIGVKDAEKIRPGQYESMCNPIAQAEILNREGCQFNIMLGLCVGHDSLFLKHVQALTTVFAVKDRLLGHNPLAALYLSRSYYRRLNSPGIASRLADDSRKEGGQ